MLLCALDSRCKWSIAIFPNPNQTFEILGISLELGIKKPDNLPKEKQGGPAFYIKMGTDYNRMYCRLAIRRKLTIDN